jgi:hypothetical protein
MAENGVTALRDRRVNARPFETARRRYLPRPTAVWSSGPTVGAVPLNIAEKH